VLSTSKRPFSILDFVATVSKGQPRTLILHDLFQSALLDFSSFLVCEKIDMKKLRRWNMLYSPQEFYFSSGTILSRLAYGIFVSLLPLVLYPMTPCVVLPNNFGDQSHT
jgi:hypothetical protein